MKEIAIVDTVELNTFKLGAWTFLRIVVIDTERKRKRITVLMELGTYYVPVPEAIQGPCN